MKQEGGWKIDRRIPVAVIMAFVLQIVGALIWATELDARVTNMEHQNITLVNVNEKFARLEERLENMKQDIVSMRHQLDQITGQLFKR